MRSRPEVVTTADPGMSVIPRSVHSDSQGGGTDPRASTTAAISTPASCRSTAAAYALSSVVNTATRSPGTTPYRCRYVRAAPASRIPGRSLPEKTSGRSCAPVACTTSRARMRHTR